jgi:predicted nucleic acid-binding protein
MAGPTVFADANVLYASALRDLLIQLAVAKIIDLRWSADVQDEWTRAVARQRPEIPSERTARTRAMMEAALPEAMVEGYEHLIPTLNLPDPDDCHVLAAAIAAEANLILTFNLKDFPADALGPHDVVALHPDQLLTTLAQTAPGPFLAAVAEIRERLVNPPMSESDYFTMLAKSGLPRLAVALSYFQTSSE